MSRMIVLVLVLGLGQSRAAVDPGTGSPLASPVLMRAAVRAYRAAATNRQARVVSAPAVTNRMVRVIRVQSQSVLAGQLVSRMSDGTTVVAPLRKATTARIPAAIDRLRSDRALARIAAAAATDPKPGKRAEALEALAVQIEAERAPKPKPEPKPRNKDKAGMLAGVAVVGGTAAYFLRRFDRGLS